MSGPPPPLDDEQRNIIDKLAVFVVKNGTEFEEMTRQKQANNPRFAFLFGGEHSQYYQYRLACENAAAASGVPMHSETDLVQSYEAQIAALQQQLSDSERNLKAQYETLILQQQTQVDAAIEKLENEKISNLTTSVGLNVDTFSTYLEQLIQNCTKENISNCKHWIMENCQTDRLREVILMYMMHR
uniref:SURP motif domain-containing protein n=1 Tax=Plectus sambesii TaxID=2011161 RepID=A0A914V3Q6_9BILA